MHERRPVLLAILDGFGLNPEPRANAVAMANKPHFDSIWLREPSTTLITFGERVGLPEGQMGNSEVGHMNIGAGRVMEQSLLRISNGLKGTYLRESDQYRHFIESLTPESTVHVIGLASDGGVHSHIQHLELLLDQISSNIGNAIRLHLITDGRDTGPQEARVQIGKLEAQLPRWPNVKIATVCGRFYAMDRDKRWERVERALNAIARGEGTSAPTAVEAIERSYASAVTDEFIEPAIITPSPIHADDAVIFWNFREDRIRQISGALTQIPDTARSALGVPPALGRFAVFAPARVLCFTEYSATFKLPFLFRTPETRNHLGEYLSALGITQLRTAETEKYPHVTYFFNANTEPPYPGEERVLIPSPRDVRTYDQKPEMSASAVTEVVVNALREGSHHFIVVNLANCDMVGHTGSLEAAVSAVQCVDTCLGKMLAALRERDGIGIIIADHGNAEQMIDYNTGSPHTSHTTYPVPMIIVGAPDVRALRADGALCDVAPTVLDLMNIPQPPEMTGHSLVLRSS